MKGIMLGYMIMHWILVSKAFNYKKEYIELKTSLITK